MKTIPTQNYEAMFLFPQGASADLKSAVEHIKDGLTKNGARIIAIKKWGDRQLAYAINKQKRGVYILAHFSVTTDKLGAIERNFNLSEQVLRQLIIRVDHLSEEEMKNSDGQLDLTIEANLKAGVGMPEATPVPSASAPAPASY